MPLSSKPSNYNLRSGEPGPSQAVETSTTTSSVSFSVPAPSLNMAGMFHLDSFRGDSTQDVERYVKRFEEYCQATGLKEKQAIATLAWHLTGLARLWYESLPVRPESLDRFKELLIEKFKKSKFANLEVYTMRQSPGETTEQFLNRLEQATYTQRIPDQLQVQIALKGMESAIANLSVHAPPTLAHLRTLLDRINLLGPSEVRERSVDVSAVEDPKLDHLIAAITQLTNSFNQLDHRCNDRRRYNNNNDNHNGYSKKQQDDNSGCRRCGDECLDFDYCRALSKTCFKCGHLDHFGNMSRTARKKYRKVRNDSENNTSQ